jgi:hypothetical protein
VEFLEMPYNKEEYKELRKVFKNPIMKNLINPGFTCVTSMNKIIPVLKNLGF